MDSERNVQFSVLWSQLKAALIRFFLALVRCAVGLGFLIGILATIYGIVCFKGQARIEERSYLLVRAAYHDEVEVVRALLRMGVDPNQLDDYCNSALDVAVYRHATASANVLRASGAVEGLSCWRWNMRAYLLNEVDRD